MKILLAPCGHDVLLSHALQLAVMAFVEAPGGVTRNGRMAHRGEQAIGGLAGAAQHGGVHFVEAVPGACQALAGLCGLRDARFVEQDVSPAGEAVAEVSFAVAVADQNQVNHYSTDSLMTCFRWWWSSQASRCQPLPPGP